MLARLDETQECGVAWHDRVDWRLDAEGGEGGGGLAEAVGNGVWFGREHHH